MGKRKGSNGKRGQRKHQKEQKRKAALGQRRTSKQGIAAPGWIHPDDSLGWRRDCIDTRREVRREGLAGLSEQLDMGFFELAFTMSGQARSFQSLSTLWTTARVAALETPELVAQLAALGVHVDRETFVDRTQGLGSAVHYARLAWLPLVPAGSDALDRDFVLLAACELWKRWRPEPPSEEMLNELMLRGYEWMKQRNEVEATAWWIRLWETLKPLLAPEVRTLEEAEALMGDSTEPLYNWIIDLADAASNAARQAPEIGRRAAGALGEMLSQLGDEEDAWRLPLITDQADVLEAAGATEEAEALLERLIADRPRYAGGYACLADLWAPAGQADQNSARRALALLEKAAALPVDSPEDWDLEERIAELRARLR